MTAKKRSTRKKQPSVWAVEFQMLHMRSDVWEPTHNGFYSTRPGALFALRDFQQDAAMRESGDRCRVAEYRRVSGR